jgi:hypothetical protein
VTFSENPEVLKLRIFNGHVNLHIHPHLSPSDLAVLMDDEDKGNYRVLLWDNGARGAPGWVSTGTIRKTKSGRSCAQRTIAVPSPTRHESGAYPDGRLPELG